MTYAKLKASPPAVRAPLHRWSPERLLVRAPDLGRLRWLMLLAVAVTLVVGVCLGGAYWGDMDGA